MLVSKIHCIKSDGPKHLYLMMSDQLTGSSSSSGGKPHVDAPPPPVPTMGPDLSHIGTEHRVFMLETRVRTLEQEVTKLKAELAAMRARTSMDKLLLPSSSGIKKAGGAPRPY